MPGELRTRSFYSDVLYAKVMKQASPLLDQSIPTSIHSLSPKERKFSFVFVNEQFMKSVKKMEDVVLVPTRLLDIEVKGDSCIPDLICGNSSSCASTSGRSSGRSSVVNGGCSGGSTTGTSNLYEVFHMLKKFRDKMQAMAVTSQEEITSVEESHEEEKGFNADVLNCSGLLSKVIDCDSGLWSLSSSASRESIDACLESSIAFSVPSSTPSCSDDRSSHSGDSESGSVDSTYVVKRSLLSAKSLCSFLTEMTAVAHFVVRKYLQEMQCDLCE